MKIKFIKTHKDAKLPTKSYDNDTGIDVYSVEEKIIPSHESVIISIGLKFGFIDPNFWIRVASKSGLGFKSNILVFPGVIDTGYRGDAGIKLFNFSNNDYKVNKGEKIAQFIAHKLNNIEVEWTEKADESHRGDKGFGSSGKK